jgi:hypothetical protein
MPDMLKMVYFTRIWKSVNQTAADSANKSMRQSLTAAFTGAYVSRNAAGQFSTLRAPQDSSRIMAWLRKLSPRNQALMSQNWAPFQAPIIGALGENPRLQVEVKPSEYSRVDLDDSTVELVTDAIVDALATDTSWIQPVVNDAANPDPFYTYDKAI